MDKLEYIPGDLVSVYVGIKKYIVEVIGTENENEVLSYQIKFPNGEIQYADKDNIVPINLVPAILEKNGWDKSIGWFYVGEEERGYQFSKELDDKWDELDRRTYGDLQICQCHNLRDWSYINECNHYFHFEFTYVHELQHLLYALHIDSNLKI